MIEILITKVFAFVIGVCGLIAVALQTNWWVALGIFLMMWGNNISIANTQKQTGSGKTKQL